MTRTFIALELNTDQQQLLNTIIEQGQQLLPDLRWVEPGGIHLTLAFLGELNDQQLAQAIAAAQDAATLTRPFTYTLSNTGIFGPPRQPRVLWMGISEPTGLLNKTHQALKLALEQHHFTTENRPFSPHLTLARIKAPLSQEQLQRLQQFLTRHQYSSPRYSVTHLYVMKSELTQSGADYSCLQTCPFNS